MLTRDVPALNICQRTEKTYLAAGGGNDRAGARMRDSGRETAAVLADCEIETCGVTSTATSAMSCAEKPATFEMFIGATASSQ